jgi:hypothetical protein
VVHAIKRKALSNKIERWALLTTFDFAFPRHVNACVATVLLTCNKLSHPPFSHKYKRSSTASLPVTTLSIITGTVYSIYTVYSYWNRIPQYRRNTVQALCSSHSSCVGGSFIMLLREKREKWMFPLSSLNRSK